VFLEETVAGGLVEEGGEVDGERGVSNGCHFSEDLGNSIA
jgi:hypothetical protein